LLLDVTPLSLGIETMGGVLTAMIPANTTIPTRKSETFSTASDNQPSVEIHILQGERPMAKDNRSLGRFHLDGIPPAPRGVPQVEVTFDIDANGILSVSAKDKATNKEQNIRIESSSGLSKDEIEKMKQEAKANEAADKQFKEQVEKRNQADAMLHSTKKQVEELGDKITAENKTKVTEAADRLEKALKENEADIQPALDNLNTIWSAVSQEMYSQQGAEGGEPGNPNSNPEQSTDSANDVEEADYTVVDDEKDKK